MDAVERIRRLDDDGALVEIIAANAGQSAWAQFISTLVFGGVAVQIRRGGVEVPPVVTSEIFESSFEISYELRIFKGAQIWTSSFFDESTIELQCDPWMIKDERDISEVVELMRVISYATSGEVVLIPETMQPESVEPILRVFVDQRLDGM